MRTCSICSNGHLKQVNKELQKGTSFRAISRQLAKDDSMRGTIRHHAGKCLGLEMRAVIADNRTNGAIDVYNEFTEQLGFAKDLRQIALDYVAELPQDRAVAIRTGLEAIKTCDITIDKFAKLGGLYQADKTNDADNKAALKIELMLIAYNSLVNELRQISTIEQLNEFLENDLFERRQQVIDQCLEAPEDLLASPRVKVIKDASRLLKEL